MMMAFEALASSTSESVIAPTPRCTTSTLTSGVESCARASASASAAPRAVLDEDRGERALAGVERRLEHRALGPAVGVGLQVEQLGLQENLVEQLLHVLARLGGDRRGQRRAAELLEHHTVRQQVLLHFLHVGGG